MAKIVKKPDAPEGNISVSVGSVHFKVSDDKPYETTDHNVIEAVQASDFLDVDFTAEDSPDTDPKQQMKDIRQLRKVQEKAEKERAEKDPLDPAPEAPQTVADLKTGDDKETK